MKSKSTGLGDKAFYFANYFFLGFILLIFIYPAIYIVSCSFSNAQAVVTGKVFLWPVKPTLKGYEAIFQNKDIMSGYGNTIFYTVVGTLLSVTLTMLAAFPLSQRSFKLGTPLMMIFAFTMYFGGGIIPTYLLVSSLGLVNTRAAMIIPGAVSVYNIIMARTFISSSIPLELLEAARIDGCSDFTMFRKIVLPLSHAIIAVIALFYAVGYWNSYFGALIYLHDRSKYPLQLILREILIQNKMTGPEALTNMTPEEMAARQALYELLKYSLIIVASVPILCVYPFIQRHFVKGVMLGAIKG